ncbi:ABC transporter ATP-binding protein, partial [Methanobrevibacter sp.]|uniref:ABC transporter ATP-binding protein n=1 Tax=Methanobrevibacter sp. TaxID=66852 RepID=UPI002E79ABD5
DDVVESVDSEGIVVDDVVESVDSEGIVVDDVVESVDSEGIVVDDMDETMSVDDALNDLMDDYSNDVVIKVNNVSMEYKLSQDKIDTLKEFFIRTIKRNKGKTKTITALKNISFEIPKGDRVGIIGFNGAGKSTLLKLLSRVYDPTEGTIETKGKIAPLLELGAGFDNNYSGKANVFLNGAFLGYSEDFIKEKYDEIVEFSELGDAINYHVKTYSSGMRAKLGFSIATIVEPDILIIDEILSVGDIKFRRKSSDKIRSLINSGITVLLVSHSVGHIRELCNKAIWIDNGELKMMGEVNKVCDAYVKAADEASNEQLKNIELN